jgi:hypothetical protein
MTCIESPRNLFWERTEDDQIRVSKFIGEVGTNHHRLLFEHTFTNAEWAMIDVAVMEDYTPPVEPLPFDDPDDVDADASTVTEDL